MVQQFEQAIPELIENVEETIEGIGIKEAMQRKQFHDSKIAPKVEKWFEDQTEIFVKRLAKSVDNASKKLTSKPEEHSWSWTEIAGAGAVVAASAAPVAVIPLAASFATVTTTSFVVFTSSAVSLPLLGAGLLGVGAVALGGQKFRQKAADKFRDLYREKIVGKIKMQALGDPLKGRKESLCGELLQTIDRIAKAELEQYK